MTNGRKKEMVSVKISPLSVGASVLADRCYPVEGPLIRVFANWVKWRVVNPEVTQHAGNLSSEPLIWGRLMTLIINHCTAATQTERRILVKSKRCRLDELNAPQWAEREAIFRSTWHQERPGCQRKETILCAKEASNQTTAEPFVNWVFGLWTMTCDGRSLWGDAYCTPPVW